MSSTEKRLRIVTIGASAFLWCRLDLVVIRLKCCKATRIATQFSRSFATWATTRVVTSGAVVWTCCTNSSSSYNFRLGLAPPSTTSTTQPLPATRSRCSRRRRCIGRWGAAWSVVRTTRGTGREAATAPTTWRSSTTPASTYQKNLSFGVAGLRRQPPTPVGAGL